LIALGPRGGKFGLDVNAEAVSFNSWRSFRILLDPLQDFLAALHFAVRTLDAVDLTMLAVEVSRA
jgi:hypothetical protein